MNVTEISVATMTLAGPDEGELLKGALRELDGRRLPTFVTDGGSDDDFLQFLQTLPNVTLETGARGVFRQAKLSLAAARKAGTPYILYTEPDKKWFFEKRLARFLKKAAKFDGIGIAFPSRTKKSLATFPKSQRLAEAATNKLCGHLLGKSADFFYGPMLIHRDLIPYLELAEEDLGWGWRPFLVGIAHRLGKPVRPIKMKLRCPKDQREDSQAEWLHRMNQLQQNVRGLHLSASIPDERLKNLVS
jgi:hypothetical protein